MSNKTPQTHLSIALNFPRKSYLGLMIFWGLLILASIIFVNSSLVAMSLSYKLIIALLVIILAISHLKLLKRHWSRYQCLIWNGEEWFLLAEQTKESIQLTADSRVLRWWILLCYRQKGFATKQLLIVKEMMLDRDYRDLSRTLRFLATPKAGDTSL